MVPALCCLYLDPNASKTVFAFEKKSGVREYVDFFFFVKIFGDFKNKSYLCSD